MFNKNEADEKRVDSRRDNKKGTRALFEHYKSLVE